MKSHKYPNRGYSVSEFIVGNIVELSVSLGGLKLGINIAVLLQETFNVNTKNIGKPIKLTLSMLSIPLTIIMLVLSVVYRDRFDSYWCLSSLFAIFGTYGRFYLSKLNGKSAFQKLQFPLGTFLTNFLASTCVSILLIIQQKYHSEHTKRLVAYSLMEGFTASLSTMSTFMNELNNMKFSRGAFYFALTVSCSYCMFIIILGSYKWTQGLDNL